MAMQSLLTGLNALHASSDWLDRVGENVANSNTIGYGQQQGTFQDALTMQLYGSATDPQNARRTTPPGWRGGTGSVAVGEGPDFTNMDIRQTGGQLDFAIQGPGFFTVQSPQGPLYTKAGNFIWSKQANGQFALATPSGNQVLSSTGQPIIRPANATTMQIQPNGQIVFNGSIQGPRIGIVEIGQPSSHLIAQSDNLYALAPGVQAQPATQSSVQQGALAYSNVDMTATMTDMLQAQRMFELNSESIQLTNQMMGIAATIKP
ncbi:flagellar hook-basal body protein [Alicyclobacillus dauci]|uniref:Flagellar hook-basal body protein n=1 Tax=Alicyclobacillus dauci TaxID=1475485 RepID=A0ABY6Z3E0_9BACL|nr:flagellar hook-basal body protein [Alicyclobacillus dauci]WAH36846.1 flagellar hook-basal body protein [Alicyclobacillus dauci]